MTEALRAIGKEIAAEIMKYFEAVVAPETITMRLSRMQQGVTNVTPQPSTSEDSGIQEKPSEERRDAQGRFESGTAAGPGRPPKYESRREFHECSHCGQIFPYNTHSCSVPICPDCSFELGQSHSRRREPIRKPKNEPRKEVLDNDTLVAGRTEGV
jgi:hypothetical protein